MRRASLFASAAILVTMLVAMSASQVNAQSGGTVTNNMMGTVISSSGTALVVRTDSGDEMAFMIDGASTVPVAINVGDRVSVAYHPVDSGKYHAATVVVETPSSTPGSYGATGTSGTSGTYTDTSLPRTASRLPLLVMIGVLSLGAAAGMRLVSRARARS